MLILASQVPFDNPFGGNPVHVHVISLSEYETGVDDALDASLVSLLETSDLVGHNIKSDVSRLNWDFNLDILESHLTDTMPLAKVLFGPPVVWNPLSKCVRHVPYALSRYITAPHKSLATWSCRSLHCLGQSQPPFFSFADLFSQVGLGRVVFQAVWLCGGEGRDTL